MATSAPSERLLRRTKILYGIGDTGFSLTGTLMGVYYLVFLTDVVGLRPGLASLAIMISRQWDWINDPIIGHLSDRTRTRWGRRRPFLLLGFMPFALMFTMLWWKPPITSQVALAAYYAFVLVLSDTVATFVYMPYFALTPELTLDYDERTSLTTYRMAFSILGGLVAFTLPWVVVPAFRPEYASRVWLNAGIFAILSGLPLLLTFLGVRERAEFSTESQPSLRASVSAALKNRPFLFATGLFLLTWMAVDIVQVVLLYFVRYWLLLESHSDTIFAVAFLTALVMLPFWEWASRHTNKRSAYIRGIAFWAVVQVAMVLVPPSPPLLLVLGLAALAGVGISAAHVLPWSIIPDTVEWDELQTGQRHEGMFYSLVMLMQKAASGLAILLVGQVLEWSGYVANAETQSPSTLAAIRAITGGAPALFLIGGILFALFYPLGRERHRALREELAERRVTHAS